MNDMELADAIGRYEADLKAVCDVFNEAAELKGVGVRLKADKAIAAIDVNLGEIASYWSRIDDNGIVHEAQLRTAVDCLAKLLEGPQRCGHVLGAMQSGKTTTSLTLQWAGPALYLLTGKRLYPFYIISNQTSHEDQTKVELELFSAYYGNLEFELAPGVEAQEIDAMFARSPTLSTYRKYVLRNELEYVQPVAPLDDLVHRRVQGHQGVDQIVALCRDTSARGFQPLMIIDEPQFGASDRFVTNAAGTKRQQCLLQQIFERIEAAVGGDYTEHRFIGLSATPFELNDLDRVWEVRQRLAPGYSGFNIFNGREIDDEIQVSPPETLGLTEFADQIGVPFLADVSMAAYDGSPGVFARHAKRIQYRGSQAEYQSDVVRALRAAIQSTLDDYGGREGKPIGMCIRAFNDNGRTDGLIARLNLDPDAVEVISYYGAAMMGMSVKRALAKRARPDLPYLIFVTNRARMADAFPAEVRFFMDFAQKASDLNALLQGLLGRACGYGKASKVVLSDRNVDIVRAYVATNGGYVMRTSRHTEIIGNGFRKGAPTGMIKLRDEMADPVVEKFFDRINDEVVAPYIRDGATKVSPPRGQRSSGMGFRTAPILLIAEQVGLFDHIESASVRAELFPQIPTGFEVARAGDAVQHSLRRGTALRYAVDGDGNCRFTFRWADRNSAAQGGAAGRARGSRDKGQHMEPTIYVEKYDPKTGAAFPHGDPRPGNWRAFMVTFPLRKPVREVTVATVAYPSENSAFDPWMDPEARALRDATVAGRRRRTAA